jgi:stalled ribosome rescue protein Dom34
VSRKQRYRRGYPVALLVGFENDYAILWRVFSRVVKLSLRLEFEGKRADEKARYNFHEIVVDSLKPGLEEGVRSIVVAAPVRTNFAKDFLEHVRKHHSYLIQSKSPNRANFAEIIGSADEKIEVAKLTKTKEFMDLIRKTTSEEAGQLVNSLDKHLYTLRDNSVVLYSLKEIEDAVYNKEKSNTSRIEYLLLTDKYLADSKKKNRIHRLLQIAKNKKVKTTIINVNTSAGTRISQFGGIVFFSPTTKQRIDLIQDYGAFF